MYGGTIVAQHELCTRDPPEPRPGSARTRRDTEEPASELRSTQKFGAYIYNDTHAGRCRRSLSTKRVADGWLPHADLQTALARQTRCPAQVHGCARLIGMSTFMMRSIEMLSRMRGACNSALHLYEQL